LIDCMRCSTKINPNHLNTHTFIPCESCGSITRAELFPAMFEKRSVQTLSEKTIAGNEAECFHHPGKPAVVHCSLCGRFLCSVCDIYLDDVHMCISCLETGRRKNQLKNLENHRILYDSMALFIAFVPFTMVLWFTTFLSAPIAIFLVFRYWNAPNSIIQRSKIRFIIALLLSCFQLVGWGAGGYYLLGL
jgi:hypothetical protein